MVTMGTNLQLEISPTVCHSKKTPEKTGAWLWWRDDVRWRQQFEWRVSLRFARNGDGDDGGPALAVRNNLKRAAELTNSFDQPLHLG